MPPQRRSATCFLQLLLPLLLILLSHASSSSVLPPPSVVGSRILSSDGGFSPLLLVDGAVNATPIEVQKAFTGECEVPNGFRDYYVDIDQEHMHKNLVLQVTLDPIVDATNGEKVELLPTNPNPG